MDAWLIIVVAWFALGSFFLWWGSKIRPIEDIVKGVFVARGVPVTPGRVSRVTFLLTLGVLICWPILAFAITPAIIRRFTRGR